MIGFKNWIGFEQRIRSEKYELIGFELYEFSNRIFINKFRFIRIESKFYQIHFQAICVLERMFGRKNHNGTETKDSI